MKSGECLKSVVACGFALTCAGAWAATYELNVPADTTSDMKTVVDAALASQGASALANGDILEKTGEGRLVATNLYQNLSRMILRVKEGVYEARYAGDLGGCGDVTVYDGASVVFNNKMANGKAIARNLTFWLSGDGHPDAATRDGKTGALVFFGENYEILNGAVYRLQADATIAMDQPRQVGMFTYGRINQQSKYRLTLLAGGHTLQSDGNIKTYQFRFRFGYGFTNAYEVVCDGGALAAHNTTYSFQNGNPTDRKSVV